MKYHPNLEQPDRATPEVALAQINAFARDGDLEAVCGWGALAVSNWKDWKEIAQQRGRKNA